MLEATENHIVGSIVGPYRVLAPIGPEGEHALFVTEHLHLDRQVALRLIATQAGWAADGLDRFLTQARKLSRVRHRNVLQLVDLGETADGQVYLATELPRGETLDRTIASQGAISAPRVRNIARQIGDALQAARQAGLDSSAIGAHQIFVTSDADGGDFVLIDFATVDILAAEPGAAPDAVSTLGRLLYQMLVGKPPLVAAGETPTGPVLARPDLEIPSDLDTLTVRALAPDPKKRWPNLDAMLRLLPGGDRRTSGVRPVVPAPRPLVHADAVVDSGASFARPRDARPSRRTPIAVGAVLATAFVLLGGGWLVRTGRLPFGRGGMTRATSTVDVRARGSAGINVEHLPPSAQPGQPGQPMRPQIGPPDRTTMRSPTTPAAGRPAGAAATSAGASAAGHGPAVASLPAAAPKRGGEEDSPAAAAAAEEPPRDEPSATASAGGRAVGDDDACAVTLGSRPWSEVWIDGHKAGFTPLVDYPIDCGSHEVLFKSRDTEIEKRVAIAVSPGKTFKKIVDLATKDARSSGLVTASAHAPAPPTCVVTLGSRPSSEVWIDGNNVGVTPLANYEIPCGKHDVLFRSSDLDVERHETIALSRGKPVKKVVFLEPAKTE